MSRSTGVRKACVGLRRRPSADEMSPYPVSVLTPGRAPSSIPPLLTCAFPCMKTFSPKAKDIQHAWWVLDAEGQPLGRLAVEAARLLRGKHKPVFAPHMDMGDYVVVVNAGKVRLTGRKAQQKMYTRHSGYPGGLRQVPYEEILAKRPALAVEKAVQGMLPRNRLGRAMGKKLRVYAGPEHPHGAHSPQAFVIKGRE